MVNPKEHVIKAQELIKRFGNFTAVDKVSFHVEQGEIFGFLGPNGAGKTTTIRMMLGLLPPTSGKVNVLGISVEKNPSQIRPRVGYMSQHFSLYNDLTVLENLRFYGRAYGLSNDNLKERINEAINMADLKGRENTLTSDLAGGWRQRLALGAAILHRPELVFLDEPTAGVDPVSRRAFWDLLYKLTEEGITIFVTTHYMDEAEHCQRLALIQRGKLLGVGTPEEIKQELMHGNVLEISTDYPEQTVEVLNKARQSGKLPLEEVALYGSLVHVIGENLESHQAALADQLQEARVDIKKMTIIEPSLEDVFISIMKYQEK